MTCDVDERVCPANQGNIEGIRPRQKNIHPLRTPCELLQTSRLHLSTPLDYRAQAHSNHLNNLTNIKDMNTKEKQRSERGWNQKATESTRFWRCIVGDRRWRGQLIPIVEKQPSDLTERSNGHNSQQCEGLSNQCMYHRDAQGNCNALSA